MLDVCRGGGRGELHGAGRGRGRGEREAMVLLLTDVFVCVDGLDVGLHEVSIDGFGTSGIREVWCFVGW